MKVGFGAIVLLMTAACCGPAPHGTAYPSPPTEALAAWQSFPANQVPRPIVMFWNSFESAGGFAGDNEKIAGMCGQFVPASPLPLHTPSEAVSTWPDGTTARYSPISVSYAVAAMTTAATSMPGPE